MVLLKKILLDSPVTDVNGEVHKKACIGLYEVYLTGRSSYLEVGFEVYKDEEECDRQALPIKVEAIGNNKRFDLLEEEFAEGVDWEDVAADKMVTWMEESVEKSEEEIAKSE